MDKMKDLCAGIEEMRSVAQRLMMWAADLELSEKDNPEDYGVTDEGEVFPLPVASDDCGPSRNEIRTLLTKLCAGGYSAQVKALIASFGAASLSAVPEGALGDLWDAAQLLGGDADAG